MKFFIAEICFPTNDLVDVTLLIHEPVSDEKSRTMIADLKRGDKHLPADKRRNVVRIVMPDSVFFAPAIDGGSTVEKTRT